MRLKTGESETKRLSFLRLLVFHVIDVYLYRVSSFLRKPFAAFSDTSQRGRLKCSRKHTHKHLFSSHRITCACLCSPQLRLIIFKYSIYVDGGSSNKNINSPQSQRRNVFRKTIISLPLRILNSLSIQCWLGPTPMMFLLGCFCLFSCL